MCMCVNALVCVYICACQRVYLRTYESMDGLACVCVNMCVSVHVGLCVCMGVYVRTCAELGQNITSMEVCFFY